MKKFNLLILSLVLSMYGFSQTTATNFNCNDCAGNNYNLFAELNSGKVIVLDWVMPCATCVGPSKTAYNIVQSYATSNPGRVVMYICDDYANSSCASTNSWVDQNGMPNTLRFSNNTIKMSDYGAAGMPKIIIVGGKDHKVFFNEIDTEAGNVAKLQAAINAALATADIDERKLNSLSYFSVNPNPAINNATIALVLNNPSEVTIELFNSLGMEIMTIMNNEKLSQGKNDIEFSTRDISNGVYFIKISEPSGSKILKLVISH